MCGIVKVHQEGRNKKMVTIGYAKYMDSDTYRRYLKAENSCRNMFHTNDVPAKPALEKRISRKTKEHLGYRIKNIEEIMGVKYTKDTANRVVKRSEEHTSELQSRGHLVCRLLLEKKNII